MDKEFIDFIAALRTQHPENGLADAAYELLMARQRQHEQLELKVVCLSEQIEGFSKLTNELLEVITDNYQLTMDGFPNQDPEMHRKYHESLIQANESQRAFWGALKLDITKKGVWGGIIILIGLIGVGLREYILEWLNK